MSHAEAHDRQLQQVFSHRLQSGEGITEPSRVGSIRGSPRLARKAVLDFLGGRSRGMGNCFLGLTSSHSPISPPPTPPGLKPHWFEPLLSRFYVASWRFYKIVHRLNFKSSRIQVSFITHTFFTTSLNRPLIAYRFSQRNKLRFCFFTWRHGNHLAIGKQCHTNPWDLSVFANSLWCFSNH